MELLATIIGKEDKPFGVPCICGATYLHIESEQTLATTGSRTLVTNKTCDRCETRFRSITAEVQSLGLIHRLVISFEHDKTPSVTPKRQVAEPYSDADTCVHPCGFTLKFENGIDEPSQPNSKAVGGRKYVAEFIDRIGISPHIVITGTPA